MTTPINRCECIDAKHGDLHQKGCKRSAMYEVLLHPSLTVPRNLCGSCARFAAKHHGAQITATLVSGRGKHKKRNSVTPKSEEKA